MKTRTKTKQEQKQKKNKNKKRIESLQRLKERAIKGI